MFGRIGELNPMFGKSHTSETKEVLSKANKNKLISEITKQKMSKALSGENNPMFEETIRKIYNFNE